jgi:hypothetical protein
MELLFYVNIFQKFSETSCIVILHGAFYLGEFSKKFSERRAYMVEFSEKRAQNFPKNFCDAHYFPKKFCTNRAQNLVAEKIIVRA